MSPTRGGEALTDPASASPDDELPVAKVRDVTALLLERRAAVGLALVVTAAGAALALVQPLLAGRVIEGVQTAGELPGHVLRLLVGVFLLQTLADTTGRYLLERVGEGVVLRSRVAMIQRVLRLRMPMYARVRRGDLISRAVQDTAALHDIAARGLVDLVVSTFAVIGALALMLVIDPVLVLVVAAVVTVAGGSVGLLLARIRVTSVARQEAVAALSADLERALAGVRTIRVAGAEDREERALAAAAREAYDSGLRLAWLSAAGTPAVQLAASGSFLVVLVLGGTRVAAGDLSLGDLVTVLLYATYLVSPLGGVLEGLTSLQTARGALSRLQHVGALPVEGAGRELVRTGRPTPRASPPAPVLEVDDISVRYGERTALQHVSFQVFAGQRVALVGRSGAGKTTVLSVVCRFVEPHTGGVSLLGRPLTELGASATRKNLALVEQDAPALYGSVRDNLLLGAPDADDGALWAVLEQVGLEGPVRRLPRGLDTPVGEHGAQLSGGERQRLALGRALLQRPALLLLDEPTSSLDSVGEGIVLAALRCLPPETAVLIITHRPSTAAVADHVIVLDEGAVAASGSPADLRGDASYTHLLHEDGCSCAIPTARSTRA